MPVYLEGIGTVQAFNTVTVRARVDGQVTKIAFIEGQDVRAGDLLAQIDPDPFNAALKQAIAKKAQDEAQLANAHIDLNRYSEMVTNEAVTPQQYDTQKALVNTLVATVNADQAAIDSAKVLLAYTTIVSPIDGRTCMRLVDQGNIVHASDANGLVVITQIQPIAVTFTLPEDDLPTVMKRWSSGKPISVEAFDRTGKNKLASGQLSAVDNQIDVTTGTVKLKAQFTNEDKTLFSNQFVNIKMKLDTLHSATIVPTSAIQRGALGSFVYVVKDDRTVIVRPVKQGPVEGEKTAIIEGLAPDEAVVVDGADKLREGAIVEVIRRESGKPQEKVGEAPESGPGKRPKTSSGTAP